MKPGSQSVRNTVEDRSGTGAREALERTRRAAARIDGWLNEAQGRALFEAAAAATGRGAIVEIGSWKGRSTAWLAAGAKLAGQTVYAIDRHAGSREDPSARTLGEFMANITQAGVEDAVQPLVMSSVEAADLVKGPVELLFVDGDHSYAGVERDAEIWFPKLVDGATVMFHDVATAGYDGPRRIFRRMVCWNSRFDRICRVGSMAVGRRTARRGPGAALWGNAAGLLLYVFDAKQLLRSIRRPRGRPSTPSPPGPRPAAES